MQKKRFFLITNPISGTRSKRKLVPKLVKELEKMGYEVTSEFTRRAGDATDLAKQAVRDGYDAVGVCGGDGTVNEAASAMCGTGVPMAIIPSGSGNGLARHIGVPVDELKALKIVARGHVDDCDYATAGERRFFCTFGVGYDAEVSHEFASRSKRGFITYFKSAVYVVRRYKPRHYHIKMDDVEKDMDAYLITVCNASQYGNNAYVSPTASVRDGLLDVVIMKPGSLPRTLFTGMQLMMGRMHKSNQTETFKCRHIEIDMADNTNAHLDGEPVKMPAHLDVDCHHGQLRLFTDGGKKPFRTILTPLRGFFKDNALRMGRLFGG